MLMNFAFVASKVKNVSHRLTLGILDLTKDKYISAVFLIHCIPSFGFYRDYIYG